MFTKAEVHLALPFAAIINVLIIFIIIIFLYNTSSFPAMTRQNVCCEKKQKHYNILRCRIVVTPQWTVNIFENILSQVGEKRPDWQKCVSTVS